MAIPVLFSHVLQMPTGQTSTKQMTILMRKTKRMQTMTTLPCTATDTLVWGVEPVAVTPEVKVKVYSQSQNGGFNSISTFVTINNEGNMPVAYGDLSVRYWFTADGTSALNSWVDYAKIGNSNVITSFNTVSPVRTSADKYFEIKIKPTLGNLYPAGNTGNIQYRIAKSDWSNFSFANDWSYKAPAQLAVNDHITVYYKGQLIYGTEPAAASQTRMAANAPAEVVDNLNAASDKIILFPNPATGSFQHTGRYSST